MNIGFKLTINFMGQLFIDWEYMRWALGWRSYVWALDMVNSDKKKKVCWAW
jgi:hypothetical protein